MITSRPVDLGQRVIYERGEKKKEKDSYCTIGQYTIVFKVIELAIYFCTCYYNDTNNNIFSNKYNIFFSMMNIVDEVSCKTNTIFASHKESEGEEKK
jgi:hypothetical protein